jgi:hypothetical protein
MESAAAVPGEAGRIARLFPAWRGLEPFEPRLAACSAMLLARHPGLAAAGVQLPFDRFEAAHAAPGPVSNYNRPPAEAIALLETLPLALRTPWLCALMIRIMGQFPRRFAQSGLPDEFALHYTDAFNRILDRMIEDPGFAELTRDSFLKDLWTVRVVMIPAFAQLWWPRSGLSARDVLRGGPRAIAYVAGCGGRRPFMEGHTHDPVARDYWNEAGWREALRLAALALPAMPHLRGAFGIAWFYDPAVKAISPRIGFAQDLQLGHGACRIRIGSDQGTVANATATSPTRRAAHAAGTYQPTDYALVWSRRALQASYGGG